MYSRGVRALRVLFRLEGWRAQGTPAKAPAVYVVHHQNMAGPIRAVAHLPLEAHVWALAPFCDAKACFRQYYGYTFTQRFGMPKPLAFLCAKLVSGAVSGIVRGCGAIPVYRGSKDIVKTMRLSQQVLEKGENILLCPDVDYSSSEAEIGAVYEGFLHLEKTYFRATGSHLAFVPVGLHTPTKTVRIGMPIFFEKDVPFARQKQTVALRLRKAITALCTKPEFPPQQAQDTCNSN